MKTKFNPFFILIACISFGFASCSDNDDEDNIQICPGVKEKLLIKIDSFIGNSEIYLFEYDTKNRLIKHTERDSIEGGTYVDYQTDKLEYDSEGRITKMTTTYFDHKEGDYSYYDFIYKKDSIIVYDKSYQKHENGYGWSDNRDTLILNQKGQLIKRIYSGKIPDDLNNYYPSGKAFYEYDSNSNLVKEMYEFNEVTSYIYTFEYDTQRSFFANQQMPAWFWVFYGDGRQTCVGHNNCTKTYENGKLESAFSYILDNDCYPLHIKSDNGQQANNVFIYKDL